MLHIIVFYVGKHVVTYGNIAYGYGIILIDQPVLIQGWKYYWSCYGTIYSTFKALEKNKYFHTSNLVNALRNSNYLLKYKK